MVPAALLPAVVASSYPHILVLFHLNTVTLIRRPGLGERRLDSLRTISSTGKPPDSQFTSRPGAWNQGKKGTGY